MLTALGSCSDPIIRRRAALLIVTQIKFERNLDVEVSNYLGNAFRFSSKV